MPSFQLPFMPFCLQQLEVKLFYQPLIFVSFLHLFVLSIVQLITLLPIMPSFPHLIKLFFLLQSGPFSGSQVSYLLRSKLSSLSPTVLSVRLPIS